MEVLVAQGIRVSAMGAHAVGNITERGRRYARWSGGPVRPGGVLVRLDGSLVSGDRWPEIVAGMLGLALAYGWSQRCAAAFRRHPCN